MRLKSCSILISIGLLLNCSMSAIIDVIDLRSEGFQSDLVLHTTIENDVPNKGEYTIHLRVTDGAIKFEKSITSSVLVSLKSPSASNLEDDFSNLVHDLFLNKLPQRVQKTLEVIGVQSEEDKEENKLRIQLNLLVGGGIKNELVSFDMDPYFENSEDEDDPEWVDKFDLFNWTRILRDDRDAFKNEYESSKSSQDALEISLQKSLKAQDDLLKQANERQTQQFKVFAKILNDFQDYNNKILSGEVIDDDDIFNLDKIKTLIDEVEEEKEVIEPKKRKLVKPKKERESKTQAEKKEKRKTRTESLIEAESVPVKAETQESIHFKFRDDIKKEDTEPVNSDDLYNKDNIKLERGNSTLPPEAQEAQEPPEDTTLEDEQSYEKTTEGQQDTQIDSEDENTAEETEPGTEEEETQDEQTEDEDLDEDLDGDGDDDD